MSCEFVCLKATERDAINNIVAAFPRANFGAAQTRQVLFFCTTQTGLVAPLDFQPARVSSDLLHHTISSSESESRRDRERER